ncbi:MAG: 50S ribosomal protein L28 [Dehalococcoidia bacterium]|nr:50S ribosomal protein L28 [Chloroflexota bacterium]MCH2314126.1 50S ribosomal protein L28 [SAR202 cluster bacterium]MCS5650123.1 50S ribosomal protein L28 [Dehalococcoidia bacterium]HAT22426.1 50S ribosomal protein L28 [Dehalococcoidia bacterium]HBR64889.1 50S ribosomal protein L28 [Dehalococcoidia bacterium]
MAICEAPNCKTQVRTGNNVSHSKRRTRRTWSPNIHKATVEINGQMKKVNLCTRCLRTIYKTAMKD